MKKPIVSVVIPVYNGEKFIRETIESVLNQTLKDFELIIVNDKSTDSTPKILKEYAKKDKRITILNNKKNMGPIHTRNNGLKIVKGKYIAALDADDVCLPKRFEIQVNYLEKHPDIFMVGGSAIVIDEESKKIGVFQRYEDYKKLKRNMPKQNCLIHPSLMYRNTEKFFYRDKFLMSDDYDFPLRVLSSGRKIVNLPIFLIKYRVNTKSMTFVSKNQPYFFNKAREFYKQRIEKGKDDYENFSPPTGKINVDPIKSQLRIRILAEFQDGQGKSVRKNIRKYFRKYGFVLPYAGYYLLSFFPKKMYSFVRKKF